MCVDGVRKAQVGVSEKGSDIENKTKQKQSKQTKQNKTKQINKKTIKKQ